MKKAIFLDRDGVINEVMTSRVKLVNKKSDFYLHEGVPEAIASFKEKGYSVFVVTNQGGVGLGFLKEETLNDIHKHMQKQILKENPKAVIDEIKACIHKPKERCSCRKPLPGMILSLAKKHQIDISQSFMVGDRESDIDSGIASGVKTVFLKTGIETTDKADFTYESLKAFSENIG